MSNTFFRFKEFTVWQENTAMKVTTDGCLFGAWVAAQLEGKALTSILDIGTGTGLLSLMVAQKNNAAIDGVEIDEDAAKQAYQNFNASPWAERLKVFHEDITTWSPEKHYDIIVSNPPFYQDEITSTSIKKNIAHHDGGLVLTRLPSIIKKLLKPSGKFYLIGAYKRFNQTASLFNKEGLFFSRVIRVKQTASHVPFRFFTEGGMERNDEMEESEIIIRDDQNEYTPAFSKYLKGYYLSL